MKKILPLAILFFSMLWVYKGVFEYGFWENGIPQGGFIPVIAGVICTLLCIVELVKKDKSSEIAIKWKNFIPVVACLVFIVSIPFLGMIVSVGIFITAWLLLLGKYNVSKAVVIGISTSGAVYLIFKLSLNVPLPVGFLGI